MDDSSTVPAVPAAASEQFWHDGTQAYPAVHDQPVGVDMPGVGNVFSAPAAPVNFVQAGAHYTPGAVPPSLDRLLQDATVIQLMFAARDLAQSRLVGHTRGTDHAFCRECRECVVSGGLSHESHCRTGRVLRMIDELEKLHLNSTAKEEAPASHANARAEDGIPPRAGDLGEPWRIASPWQDVVHLVDRDGSLVGDIYSGDGGSKLARARALRIADCVNFAAPKAGAR
jgi:hypothetical protein